MTRGDHNPVGGPLASGVCVFVCVGGCGCVWVCVGVCPAANRMVGRRGRNPMHIPEYWGGGGRGMGERRGGREVVASGGGVGGWVCPMPLHSISVH